VDIVGPSNIFTLLESVPAYWEAGRAFLYGMVGDPNTEEGKKLIQEASPLFSAEKIIKPLLIIQGANDPRVKKAEADQIAIALRDRGHDVAYLLADDEGHGFAKPVNRMAMYAEIEKFLAEKLGGRYQEGMPDDVAKRLSELRVDISTVVFAPADDVKTADVFPTPEVRFLEGNAAFDVNIEVQGQNMAMETKRTVAKNGDQWIVTDETKGPMGDVSETMTYGADLKPVSRKINQMGQNIEMQYHADKVAVSAMGQKIEIPYEGALLSTGPGYETVIGGLPLKTGYEIVVMVPDVNTMKAKQHRIKVVGEDEMNGEQYWKVELTALENENEKTTLWINKVNHMTDQMEQSAPAMGNAFIKTTRKG
jgi:hypothetical protein